MGAHVATPLAKIPALLGYRGIQGQEKAPDTRLNACKGGQ